MEFYETLIQEDDQPDENPYNELRFAEDEPEATTATTPEEDPDEDDEPQTPVPQVALQDPGDYVPTDYSFQVQLYNDENKPTKQVKITSVEDFEALLDDEANFGTASALLKAQRLSSKLETNTERDQNAYNDKKAAYEQQKKAAEANDQWLATTQKELDYLVAEGDLPKIPQKFKNANWNDDEVAKDPGVIAQKALLTWMDRENAKLKQAGLPAIQSITDAFNRRENKAAKQAKQSTQQAQTANRRTQAAKVAGAAGSPRTVAPTGIAVGRPINLRDL